MMPILPPNALPAFPLSAKPTGVICNPDLPESIAASDRMEH
ncbi:MAG TPA: hypothetical protein V6C65_17640 [Allocoleopsis sp.]